MLAANKSVASTEPASTPLTSPKNLRNCRSLKVEVGQRGSSKDVLEAKPDLSRDEQHPLDVTVRYALQKKQSSPGTTAITKHERLSVQPSMSVLLPNPSLPVINISTKNDLLSPNVLSPRPDKKLKTLKELKPETGIIDQRIDLLVRGVSPHRNTEKRT